ncbi:uncharacterized protein Tco025E_07233 [Trypanosoma conorhini]|uniref:Uncharacterized protein n=1 Tax=Trypanosoma conorhini TaxID=83891 RepID=A0A422NVY9_9TRYP|nr:uncharacterized protein Tco025E_07233 [Trypanosoma conorhini]RNF09627.1 hypothetical protein Tco025E_07233 [Trypanosoma conorhini]
MNPSETTLSDAERYSIWCEEVRALFSPTGTGEEDDAAATEADRPQEWGRAEDGGEFPYCFYMRMLSGGSKEAVTHGMPDAHRSCSSGIGSVNGGGRSDCCSSTSQHKGRQILIDEDALAARVAAKLNAHARKLRRKHEENRAEVRQVADNLWNFRDGRVEAVASKVNEELHELLMYVRRRNLLAEQLRRQLVQTKQLLLQQKEKP